MQASQGERVSYSYQKGNLNSIFIKYYVLCINIFFCKIKKKDDNIELKYDT